MQVRYSTVVKGHRCRSDSNDRMNLLDLTRAWHGVAYIKSWAGHGSGSSLEGGLKHDLT